MEKQTNKQRKNNLKVDQDRGSDRIKTSLLPCVGHFDAWKRWNHVQAQMH